jgi:hypothetical protein
LTSKAIELGTTYRKITGFLAVSIVVVPFGFATLIASLSGAPRIAAIILGAVTIIGIAVANFVMPRALADNVALADNLRFELLINRLAGQIALQNMTHSFPSGEDRQAITWFTSAIEPAVRRKCEGKEADVRGIINYCPHWKDSMLALGDLDLSVELDHKLFGVAESIAQIARIIFNSTQCTVKIYIRTTHQTALGATAEPLDLLTAVGRFPPGERGCWKSWIRCSGRDADVWQAFRRKEVLVFQHVKSVAENKRYPTIACIPLPGEFGVITIEANDPYTFMPLDTNDEAEERPSEAELRTPVPDHVIDQDLHRSLAVSVGELVLRAIRTHMPSPEPSA